MKSLRLMTPALIVAAASVANAQDCLWTSLAVPGPGDRKSAAIAYDSARDRVILFGGYNSANSGLLNDTWEWDGASWTLRATTGPSPRGAAAMAFDSARNRTVLFSGNNSIKAIQQQASDTWEWDGTDWTQRATGTISAGLSRTAMAFDVSRARTVAFTSTTTREWDGNTWAVIPVAAPHSAAGQTMVYDSMRQKVVMLCESSGQPTTVWEYDGAGWSQRATVGTPPVRRQYDNAAAVFDPTRGRIIMVGGETTWEDYAPETWEWDTTTGEWFRRTVAHPGPRPGPALVWDPVRSRALLFGRSLALTGGETWFYNPAGTGELIVTGQPVSQTVILYNPVSFTAIVPGATTYQWYKFPPFGTTGVPISGATSDTYSIASAGLTSAGAYMVVAEGPCGPAFARATLNVTSVGCYPDCDGVGGLTAGDFICFLTAFNNGGATGYADCDGVGGLTANDFACYLARWVAGCG
jgi:hypothetical protein